MLPLYSTLLPRHNVHHHQNHHHYPQNHNDNHEMVNYKDEEEEEEVEEVVINDGLGLETRLRLESPVCFFLIFHFFLLICIYMMHLHAFRIYHPSLQPTTTHLPEVFTTSPTTTTTHMPLPRSKHETEGAYPFCHHHYHHHHPPSLQT